MLPAIALCDPELTCGLPRDLTAATVSEAISDCAEPFIAPAFNPPAEAIALDGLVQGMRALKRTKTAFAVTSTGERRPFANIIPEKGARRT